MVAELLERDDADRLFHALADATRRDIVRRVLDGEHSVSSLAAHYPMSVTAVQKHVAVLEGAGLVTKHRRGREALVRGEVAALRRASRLLDELESFWRDRMDRLDAVLAEEQDTAPPTPTRSTRPGGEAR